MGQAGQRAARAGGAEMSARDDTPEQAQSWEQRRTEVLTALRELADSEEPEIAHSEADDLLLWLIDDAEIAAAFDAVPKWYA